METTLLQHLQKTKPKFWLAVALFRYSGIFWILLLQTHVAPPPCLKVCKYCNRTILVNILGNKASQIMCHGSTFSRAKVPHAKRNRQLWGEYEWLHLPVLECFKCLCYGSVLILARYGNCLCSGHQWWMVKYGNEFTRRKYILVMQRFRVVYHRISHLSFLGIHTSLSILYHAIENRGSRESMRHTRSARWEGWVYSDWHFRDVCRKPLVSDFTSFFPCF